MSNAGEMEFDLSVLQESKDTYSSLTDMNGADLFTDTYQEKVMQFKQEQDQVYQTVKGEVFVRPQGYETDPYAKVKATLFQGTETRVMKEENLPPSSKTGLVFPIILIISIVLFLIMFSYVNKRRRKWREYEADIDNYE